MVVGSSPTRGAREYDTNSKFSDEPDCSPSPAIGGAGVFEPPKSCGFWREMKQILMFSGE
ncbi:MAG: hypothetical protein QMD50_02220 [Patescibacteria group bacterium]|nr:hypothetical protein [Patescibacteria group bacterium]